MKSGIYLFDRRDTFHTEDLEELIEYAINCRFQTQEEKGKKYMMMMICQRQRVPEQRIAFVRMDSLKGSS